MDNNEGQTIWNNKIFSDSNENIPNIDNDFQTENMIRKIKNTKNKKKNIENYKNMELLENIYENDDEKDEKDDNDQDEKEEENPPAQKKGKKTLKDSSLREKYSNKNPLGLRDSDYDGLDSGDKGKTGPINNFIRFINNIFTPLDDFNENKAKYIAEILSNHTNTKNDVKIIKKYMALFESIIMAYLFTYSYIYITFYKNITDKELKLKIFDIFHGDLFKNMSENTSNKFLKAIYSNMDKIFRYPLLIIENFLWIFFKYIPIKINNLHILVLFIFSFLIFTIFHSSSNLKTFITDALRFNMKNKSVAMISGAIILLFLYECFDIFNIPVIKTIKDLFSMNSEEIQKDGKEIIHKTNSVRKLFMMPYIVLFVGFIQFFIVSTVGVPIFGVLFTLLFLIAGSFIFTYTFFYDRNINIFDVFKKIDVFIATDYNLDFQPDRNDLSNTQRFQLILQRIIATISANIFYIALIITLIISIGDYFKNINSSTLRINLLFISMIFIFIACNFVYITSEYKLEKYSHEKNVTIKKNEEVTQEQENNFEKILKSPTEFVSNIKNLVSPPANEVTNNTHIPNPLQKIQLNTGDLTKNLTQNLTNMISKPSSENTTVEPNTPTEKKNHLEIAKNLLSGIMSNKV